MANENALPSKAEAKAARKAAREAYSPIVKRLRLWVLILGVGSWLPYVLTVLAFMLSIVVVIFALFDPAFWQGAAHVGILDFFAGILAAAVILVVIGIFCLILTLALLALGIVLIAQRKKSAGTSLAIFAFVSAGLQLAILFVVFVAPTLFR